METTENMKKTTNKLEIVSFETTTTNISEETILGSKHDLHHCTRLNKGSLGLVSDCRVNCNLPATNTLCNTGLPWATSTCEISGNGWNLGGRQTTEPKLPIPQNNRNNRNSGTTAQKPNKIIYVLVGGFRKIKLSAISGFGRLGSVVWEPPRISDRKR